MTEPSDDRDLRDEFGRLRSAVEAPGRAPDFDAMIARARAEAAEAPKLRVESGGARVSGSARRRALVGGWATVAAAAAVAAIVLLGDRPGSEAEFEALVAAYSSDAAGAAWRSPTSGLLAVPGMELTRSVPSVGEAARGLDPRTRPTAVEPPGRDS